MDPLSLFLLCIVVGLISLWWWQLPNNPPPGPSIFWALRQIFKYNHDPVHVSIKKFSALHDELVFLKFGTRSGLMLNGWVAMKEALLDQAQVFSGRPRMYLIEIFTKRKDILSSDGPHWIANRRFAIRHLSNLGVAKTSMEGIILGEVDKVKEIIDSHGNGQVDMSDIFFMPILNILWFFVAGRTYEYDDDAILSLSRSISEGLELLYRCAVVEAIPFFRFMPWLPFPKLLERYGEIYTFLKSEVAEHIVTYQDGTIRDFIDAYLCEKKVESECGDVLPFIILNFFVAGIETIQTTLQWGFLYMATWPEIQEKVQRELDTVIGRDRLPSYSDITLLPYTESVLLEVYRYSSIIANSFPHSNIKDAKVLGYNIPKRTYVIQNIKAIHFDPKLWGDPEVFRPERFIDENGSVKKPEYLIPFSLGPRKCFGESLSKMEVFLFFTSILQKYYLRYPTGEKPPSLEPDYKTVVKPKKYAIAFNLR